MTFQRVAGSVFALVAGLHLWRAVAEIPVQVGATAVPQGLSWLAVAVAGSLAGWAFRSRG